MSGPRRADLSLAVVLDSAALVAFVAIGRANHHLHGSGGWFLTVLWPFLAGWFAAALVTGLYTGRAWAWIRAAVTALLGVTLALVLRAAVTGRPTPVVFGVVALSFVSLATLGWRAAARGVRRVVRFAG